MMELNIEQYLKKFKVRTPKTLFPPSAKEIHNALSNLKCIYCGHKLYVDRKGNGRCKQADKFFIKAETLAKYL